MADTDRHDEATTDALAGEEVASHVTYGKQIRDHHLERLQQARTYRALLFWFSWSSLIVLLLGSIGLVVAVSLGGIQLNTGTLATIVAGTTAQIVSIVIVVGKSVFPETDTDYQTPDPPAERPIHRRSDTGFEAP